MSTYQPRRGPNVSQLIASLNAIADHQDDGYNSSSNNNNNSNGDTSEGFGIDDDELDLFMHTEFLDDFSNETFDSPLGPALQQLNPLSPPSPLDPPQQQQQQSPTVRSLDSILFDPGRALHQGGTSDTSQTLTSVTSSATSATSAKSSSTQPAAQLIASNNRDIEALNFEDDFNYSNGLPYITTSDAPLQLAPVQSYGSPAQDFDLNFPSPTSPYDIQHIRNPTITPSPPNGKRAAGTDPAVLEASSRAAAEEDKRRRNTAASARFRVKKKQREQALEKTAKEMTDKCEQLEQRVDQLEMENKWLKGLVVEKTAKGGDEVAELWKKFKEDRTSKFAKRGVGTPEA